MLGAPVIIVYFAISMRFYYLMSALLLLIACNKNNSSDNTDPNRNNRLTAFRVTVLERNPTTAILQWDTCFNAASSEPVKYRVILEGNIISDSLLRLSDTLKNLNSNTSYLGKVVAFTSSDTISAPFSLSTYEGFIYAFSQPETGNPFFGGYYAYPASPYTTAPPIWTTFTGSSGMPVVSNDTLFVVMNKRLNALHASNGAVIWQADPGTKFSGSATYNNGRLYGCTDSGQLIAVNTNNGGILWSYSDPNTIFSSTPVTDGGKVFASNADWSNCKVYALDELTGQKLWSSEINNSMCSRPLAVNGVLVVSSGNEGRVWAFDENTGATLWTKEMTKIGRDAFNPIYADGKVLVHTDGGLYALNLKTGGVEWTYDNGGSFSGGIAGNGRIYFSSDSSGGRDGHSVTNLVCLDANDGRMIWKKYASPEAGEMFINPVFAKDKIYCIWYYTYASLSYRKTIVAFNAFNGNRDSVIWRNGIAPFSVSNYCVKRDGIVYYPSGSGNYR